MSEMPVRFETIDRRLSLPAGTVEQWSVMDGFPRAGEGVANDVAVRAWAEAGGLMPGSPSAVGVAQSAVAAPAEVASVPGGGGDVADGLFDDGLFDDGRPDDDEGASSANPQLTASEVPASASPDSVDPGSAAPVAVNPGSSAAPEAEAVKPPPQVHYITVRIPVILDSSQRVPLQVGLRWGRSDELAKGAMGKVFSGLRAKHAVLPNGQHVDKMAQVIKWLFSEIAGELAALPAAES